MPMWTMNITYISKRNMKKWTLMHNFIWFLQNNQTQLVGICQFDTFTRHQEKTPNILLLET